jgi:hypothetical protein
MGRIFEGGQVSSATDPRALVIVTVRLRTPLLKLPATGALDHADVVPARLVKE